MLKSPMTKISEGEVAKSDNRVEISVRKVFLAEEGGRYIDSKIKDKGPEVGVAGVVQRTQRDSKEE